MTRRKKYLVKEMRAYILASHVIDGDTQLHDLGGIYISYLAYIPFERLDDGYTTECRLGMRFVTWCIVKLYFYVNLCRSCNIIIVANYTIHLGIKIIYCSWVVGDVTKTPNFYEHIQVNYSFFTREKYCSIKATRSSQSAFLITGYKMY